MERIVDRRAAEHGARLAGRGVALELGPAARAWLALRGYDRKMGARPMARVLQEHIKRPLAEELLFGTLAGGGSVLVTVAENGESLALDCRPSKTPELLGQD